MLLAILKAITTFLGFFGRAIQAVEMWLARKSGIEHQLLADKSADIAKLQAEAVARANAGSAIDALKRHDF